MGDRLRVILAKMPKGQRMTQSELAEKIGVHRNTVRHWISGRSEPTEENLERLCEVLGLHPGELLGYGGSGEIDVPTPYEPDDWKPGDSARALIRSVSYILEVAPRADISAHERVHVGSYKDVGRWTAVDDGIWHAFLAGRRLIGPRSDDHDASGSGAAPRTA